MGLVQRKTVQLVTFSPPPLLGYGRVRRVRYSSYKEYKEKRDSRLWAGLILIGVCVTLTLIFCQIFGTVLGETWAHLCLTKGGSTVQFGLAAYGSLFFIYFLTCAGQVIYVISRDTYKGLKYRPTVGLLGDGNDV